MPTFISGLPVHVLVVHAVVVLVPLAVLGSLAIALWPAARRRFGWLVVAVAAVANASIPIATSSGEGLEHNLPRTPQLTAHTHLGDQLLPLAGLLLLAVAGLMLLDRRRSRATTRSGPGTMAAHAPAPAWLRPVGPALSLVTVALAVVTAVQVVRIGDSGARAAWGDVTYVQQAPDRAHRDGGGNAGG